MKDSIIRTTVPLIVGWVVVTLAKNGVEIDDDTKVMLVSAATSAVSFLYYVAVRLLERWKPKLGWLLGVAKQPVYVEPVEVPKAA